MIITVVDLPPDLTAIWNAFHRAWTLCVGTPAYDKAAWMAAERQLLAVIGNRRGVKYPCDQPLPVVYS